MAEPVIIPVILLNGSGAGHAPAFVAACRQAMADAERGDALCPDQPAAPQAGFDGGITQRPWGRFHSIARGERFQVKHIEVDPGAKLSLQKHWHRSEHWVVVAGTALVTNGDSTFVLRENQSTFIPATVVHRLENPGKVPLRLIEVQSGEYVGEDDIVRLEDSYGR